MCFVVKGKKKSTVQFSNPHFVDHWLCPYYGVAFYAAVLFWFLQYMGKSELKELWAFTVVLTLCHNILGSIELRLQEMERN